MSSLNITQPLGIWSMPWLLFQVMSNIPKMGQLPTPVIYQHTSTRSSSKSTTKIDSDTIWYLTDLTVKSPWNPIESSSNNHQPPWNPMKSPSNHHQNPLNHHEVAWNHHFSIVFLVLRHPTSIFWWTGFPSYRQSQVSLVLLRRRSQAQVAGHSLWLGPWREGNPSQRALAAWECS